MPAALERRLQRAFGRLPHPTREATRRARASALATLPTEEPRSPFVVVLALTGVALVLGAGAAALAATGNLHVRIGREQPRAQRAPAHLQVPRGTNGLAVVAGGKLWLATRRGLRIEGMPVSAAELSPRSLYAALGVGSSLVAMAPGRRLAWSRDVGGGVVAASWSPDGLKIAYVVRRRMEFELRLIEGDGDRDRTLVPSVAPVQPSWRFDSLAVAYVNSRRQAAVHYLSHGVRRAFDTRRCGGLADHVAYARHALRLAVATRRGLAVVDRWDRKPRCVRLDTSVGIGAIGWLRSEQVVAATYAKNARGGSVRRFGRNLNEAAAAVSANDVAAVAADPGAGSRLVVAVRRPDGIVDVAAVPEPAFASRLQPTQRLLRLRRVRGSAVSLSWR